MAELGVFSQSWLDLLEFFLGFFVLFFLLSIEVMSSGGGWSKSVVSKCGSLLSHKLSLLFMENCQLNSE